MSKYRLKICQYDRLNNLALLCVGLRKQRDAGGSRNMEYGEDTISYHESLREMSSQNSWNNMCESFSDTELLIFSSPEPPAVLRLSTSRPSVTSVRN